jgi:hypothetical protein
VPLDFKTPFDELTELRSILTTREIADLTGLRRETLSRARPDRRFHRRTEKALGDLYLVVTRMRSVAGADLPQLGAILRRPQADIGGRSIGELLKEGKVDVVLEHLAAPAETAAAPRPNRSKEEEVEVFLAADPEMASLLPEIEAKLRRCFAPVKWIERGVSVEAGAEDVLYLWAHNGLPPEENFQRLETFLGHERDFLRPVRSRLNAVGVQ